MPVARSTGGRKAVLIALGGVVSAIGLIVVVVFLASDRGGDAGNLGGPFEISVETLLDQGADEIAVCFPDPVQGDRPICVFHAGEEDDEGWVAYDAQVDGVALSQDRETGELTDPDGDVVAPDGTGLDQYFTEVVDERLLIDLGRAPGEPDPDAAEGSTTTSSILVTGDEEG